MRLSEAFKALDALNEDTFTLSDDGIKKLAEFENNDDLVDELSVIDLDAETEEDFQDSYVGKVILDCCVCHSKLYKDKADVTIDEESQLANVGEDCPYCYTPDGFKIVGEVAEFNKESEEENVDNEPESDDTDDMVTNSDNTDIEDEDDKDDEVKEELTESIETDDISEEELEEGIFGKKKGYYSKEAIAQRQKEMDDEFEQNQKDERRNSYKRGIEVKNDWDRHDETARNAQSKAERDRLNKIKGDKPSNTGHKGVNYSGGDYYSEDLDEGIFDGKKKKQARYESKEINEDINNISVDTDDTHMEVKSDDNGKVTVTTEPVDNMNDDLGDGDEVVVPVSDETITDIENNDIEEPTEGEDDTVSDTEVDLEIEDFDEESFDDLGEQYFREAYENVETFKTSNVTETKKGLMIEGVLKFTSGNTKKTSFLFESKLIDKENTVKFIGENIDIKTGKAAFTMTGKVSENKLILESLSYNYETDDEEGNKNKVSGIVKRG